MCIRDSSRIALARLADRFSGLRYHRLLVVDPGTGRIRESLTEGELAQRLFHAQAECRGR